jgi:hypothetical protein
VKDIIDKRNSTNSNDKHELLKNVIELVGGSEIFFNIAKDLKCVEDPVKKEPREKETIVMETHKKPVVVVNTPLQKNVISKEIPIRKPQTSSKPSSKSSVSDDIDVALSQRSANKSAELEDFGSPNVSADHDNIEKGKKFAFCNGTFIANFSDSFQTPTMSPSTNRLPS